MKTKQATYVYEPANRILHGILSIGAWATFILLVTGNAPALWGGLLFFVLILAGSINRTGCKQ